MPGREAVLKREGRRLVLEPVGRPSLLEVLATLKPLDEDFAPIEALPVEVADFDGLAACALRRILPGNRLSS